MQTNKSSQGQGNPKELTPEEKKAKQEAEEKKIAELEAKKKQEAFEKRVKSAQTRVEENSKGKKEFVQSDLLPEVKERHLFHVEVEKIYHDPNTGEKKSKAAIQKYTMNEFKLYEQSIRQHGYTVKVLWNPINYNK